MTASLQINKGKYRGDQEEFGQKVTEIGTN